MAPSKNAILNSLERWLEKFPGTYDGAMSKHPARSKCTVLSPARPGQSEAGKQTVSGLRSAESGCIAQSIAALLGNGSGSLQAMVGQPLPIEGSVVDDCGDPLKEGSALVTCGDSEVPLGAGTPISIESFGAIQR